jgi:hypothetical protein
MIFYMCGLSCSNSEQKLLVYPLMKLFTVNYIFDDK